MLAALYRASMLGGDLVDAAEMYAWGLTREFDTIGAAWRARVAPGVGPGRSPGRRPGRPNFASVGDAAARTPDARAALPSLSRGPLAVGVERAR